MLFLIIIVSIIALLLLAAAIMKKEVSISSEIIINRSQADIFNYIKYLKNQEKYSKWVMLDPNCKILYTGTDGTIGSKAAWNSEVKNVGVGEQEIINITEGVGYEVEIRFEKPFKGTSYAKHTTQPISENQTKFTSTFSSTTPFPMNLMSAMLKNMLLKDMNETSSNLKKVLES